MTTCLKVIEVSGQLVLSPDPLTQDLTTCQYVVESGAYSTFMDFLSMTPTEAHAIAGAAAGVLALAWVFRVLIRLIDLQGVVQDE